MTSRSHNQATLQKSAGSSTPPRKVRCQLVPTFSFHPNPPRAIGVLDFSTTRWSKNRVLLRSGCRSHRRTAHVGRIQRDLCLPPIRLWRREMRVFLKVPKSTQKQYTRARAGGRAPHKTGLAKPGPCLGAHRTPDTAGAGKAARPSGGVQTTHAAPLRIAFCWSLAIYAFLPVVADGPSRARCDDELPACAAGLAMAVLAAPWVRPGEGRFSYKKIFT